MSYSVQASRRSLPLQLLALPFTALLVWLLPHGHWATNLERWYLVPAWIALAHLLTASSYLITALRLRPAWFLLTGSIAVYRSRASATHLAAAFLVALGEEAVFRLALLPWLAALTGAIPSVLLLSALFSALHAGRTRSFRALSDYFVFGVVLAAVTLATQSLLPALVLHTFRNYILRCLLVSREEYDAEVRAAQK